MLKEYIQRTFYNTFFYVIAGGFVRLLSFLTLPYFLTKLPLSDFGLLDFYQSIFSMGTLVLSSCAAIAMTRFYLLHKDDEELQRKSIGNALVVALSGAICAGGIALLVYAFKHDNFYSIITLVNMALFALFSMVLAYFRMREQMWYYLTFFCGQNGISVMLTFGGIYYGYGIDSFFYSNAISYCIGLPVFIYLYFNHRTYSFDVLTSQLKYSVPLLVYSVIYSCFITVDRFFIKNYAGYEMLGTYALLWRFGSVFQFAAIALMDAWPIIMFNAHKEKNSTYLLSKLTTYLSATHMTLCLGIIVASRMAIGWFFPYKYYFLFVYLPLFFVFVMMLEIVKVFQSGFALSGKTGYTPAMALASLSIQAGLLYVLIPYGIWGVLLANGMMLIMYAGICYVLTRYVYTTHIFNLSQKLKLAVLFIGYVGMMQGLLWYEAPWYFFGGLLVTWPVALWFAIVDLHEKKWLQKFIGKKQQDGNGKPTILYLRTDISFNETKVGGSVAHTIGVIHGFKQAGYEIVAASSNLSSIFKLLQVTYFRYLRVYPIFFFLRWKFAHLRWRLDCLFSNVFFTIQILKWVGKRNIDFIYQRYSLLNCVGVLVSAWKKIPLVLEYNGSEVWAYDVWGESTIFKLKKISRYIEQTNLKKAHYIIVVSQVLKDDLIARGIPDEKILVNPNGVDPDVYDPEKLNEAREIIRTELNIKDKFVFGFIGTFSYWHGIEVIAQMIPEVVRRNQRAHFLLIGDGPLKEYIQKYLHNKNVAQQHVTFTGTVLQDEAKKYLAACDAFLCPTQPNSDGTRFFGSPTKLFEYMSLAKPIIASDLEQVGEVLRNNSFGKLIQPTDVQGFIDAAISLLEIDKNLLGIMGNNARQHAISYYSWDRHSKKILTFIKR